MHGPLILNQKFVIPACPTPRLWGSLQILSIQRKPWGLWDWDGESFMSEKPCHWSWSQWQQFWEIMTPSPVPRLPTEVTYSTHAFRFISKFENMLTLLKAFCFTMLEKWLCPHKFSSYRQTSLFNNLYTGRLCQEATILKACCVVYFLPGPSFWQVHVSPFYWLGIWDCESAVYTKLSPRDLCCEHLSHRIIEPESCRAEKSPSVHTVQSPPKQEVYS